MSKNIFRTNKQSRSHSESRVMRGTSTKPFAELLRGFVLLVSLFLLPLPALMPSAAAQKPTEPANSAALQAAQNIVAKQASLVTEFDVNGLKVLVKRREGSLTVATGLFIRGGSRNITANNAGIEALMLSAATEASANFPRERMRTDLSRMGTVLNSAVNYDYSSLSLITTRPNFDRSWDMFADVALHPAFTKEVVELAQSRIVASLKDDTDDPDTYLQRLQEKAAYAGHPYSNRAEGTAE